MESIKKVYPSGTIHYFNEHGQLHRENGPAWIYTEGREYYFLNDIKYSYEQWLKLIPNPVVIKWREFCGIN